MAYFKIKLLTPQKTDKMKISFLESVISEFYSQDKEFLPQNEDALLEDDLQQKILDWKHSYCYSFNESVAFHQGGQKELKFSMMQNIWVDDKETINPFVNVLHVGSQVLLIDKYNNEYIFTVKSINFTFKNQNLIYDYTCQDSFTYQMIRQNDGYTIDNDPESEDFIGAKSIDWWVVNKIQPECYIGYQYIPLFQGLYLTKNGELKTYFKKDKKYLVNVDKIIKPAYDVQDYPEYHEKVPFSVSGSNAASSLISLGESLGLSLNFKESKIPNSTSYDRYFWFEPTKNENVSDLSYSPHHSVSNFSLNYDGSALTTIMNVESNTINDEVVSMIPEVPAFFRTLFGTRAWKNSVFYDGYFSSICQGKTYKSVDGISEDFNYEIEIDNDTYITEDNKYLYIKLKTNNDHFEFPQYYPHVSLFAEKQLSYIYVNYIDGQITKLTPENVSWDLVFKSGENEQSYTDVEDSRPITSNSFYLKIEVGYEISEIKEASIILNFYRDATEEEIEFAEMADKCPWLENKLIDLSFFIQQGIMNKSEYVEIMNVIENELRIINGQLLLYTASYYEAIHNKTRILAELTNDLDSVGAAFNADVIKAYSERGLIGEIDYFQQAYNSMTNKYYSTFEKTPLVNYDQLLTDYFNKYFSAQQRFLKNMYSFKNYFEAPIEVSGSMEIWDYELTLNSSTSSSGYVSFENQKFEVLDLKTLVTNEDGEVFIPIFRNNKKTRVEIVNKKNVENYWVRETNKIIPCESKEIYSSKNEYFRKVYKCPTDMFENLQAAKREGVRLGLTYIGKDNGYFLFGNINPEVEGIEDTPIGFSSTYIPVSYNDMVWEYLYRMAREGDYCVVENQNNYESFYNLNSKSAAYYFTKYSNEDAYLKDLPIQTLYMKNQPVYSNTLKEKKDDNGEIMYYYYERVNEDGKTFEDYINGKTTKNPFEYTKTYEIPLLTKNSDPNTYFKRSGKTKDASYWVSGSNSDPLYLDFYGNSLGKGKKTGFYEGDKVVYALKGTSYIDYLRKQEYNNYQVRYENKLVKKEDGTYEVIQTISKDATDWFFKYKDIGLTIKAATSPEFIDKLYYKESWMRPLVLRSKMEEKTYYIAYQRFPGDTSAFGELFRVDEYLKYFVDEYPNMNEKRFSTVQHHFLLDQEILGDTIPKTFSALHGETCREALQRLPFFSGAELSMDSETLRWITSNKNGYKYKFLVLSLEDFKYNTVINKTDFQTDGETLKENKRFGSYNGEKILTPSGEVVNFKKLKNFTEGFYKNPLEEVNYIQATVDMYEKPVTFYKKNGETYSKAYTSAQLYDIDEKLYYLHSSTHSFTSQGEDTSEQLKLLLHTVDATSESPTYFNFDWSDGNFDEEGVCQFNSGAIKTVELNLDDKNKYTISFSIKRVKNADDATGLNNGQFWMKFHDRLDLPFMMEKAIAIETQLMTYWQQAYNASLYCEYFVPQYWQPFENGKENHMNKLFFATTEQSGNGRVWYDIKINPFGFPKVTMASVNGKTRLQKYNIRYGKQSKFYEDDIKRMLADTMEYSGNILLSNQAYVAAFRELDEDYRNLVVEELPGVYTNYYCGEGGIKWNQLLSKISDYKYPFELFSGLHKMAYLILKKNYANREFVTYNELQNKKQLLWQNLHQRYSGFLLEGKFSNADATTSQELYQLAKNAMRDKTEPEKGYSVAVIDHKDIFGYHGQELKIGTGIRVAANEFYENYDKLQRDISQFMFITDISYTLRKPDDINLTVNAIKYQDKLIQRLVKLIK